jgi:hypothetical protein
MPPARLRMSAPADFVKTMLYLDDATHQLFLFATTIMLIIFLTTIAMKIIVGFFKKSLQPGKDDQ